MKSLAMALGLREVGKHIDRRIERAVKEGVREEEMAALERMLRACEFIAKTESV